MKGRQDTLESLTLSVEGLGLLLQRINSATGQLRIGIQTVSRRMEDFTMASLQAEAADKAPEVAPDVVMSDLESGDTIRELGETLAEFEERGIPLRIRESAPAKDSNSISKQVLRVGGTHEITLSVTIREVNPEGGAL